MDRNTIIGFVLLGLLLFVYLYINTKSSHELEAQRKHIADSVAFVTKVKEDAAAAAAKSAAVTGSNDTAAKAAVDTTGFNRAFSGKEQLVTLENELVRVVLSNKGGQPVNVELKKFKSYDSTLVRLIGPGPENRINYPINTGNTGARDIAELYFNAGQVVKNADGSQTIRFVLPAPAGQGITHTFTLPADAYTLNWNIDTNMSMFFYRDGSG